MKKYIKQSLLVLGCTALILSCKTNKKDKKENVKEVKKEVITLASYSKTPNFLKLDSTFASIKIHPILSSEDALSQSPNFVYGSAADGAGLLKNEDGTFSLINNMEADFSIARIKFDKTFKPVAGEYIVNAKATGYTAQCSGYLITPEEHGFGPLYLSGGEAGGGTKGVYVTDPYKKVANNSSSDVLEALGEWNVENAVAIGKNAYPDKTVVFIGDDHADNTIPSGQLGMYVGNKGDLKSGKLYGLKVDDKNVKYEIDLKEGESYPVSFVELKERELDKLDAECKKKGVMGFARVEDIDWRKGSAQNNRTIYFCATGRKADGLKGKGNEYGRVYEVQLNETDPTKSGKITCVLDGDNLQGQAKHFQSPDNIVVTENYAYIQEDPNGYFDLPEKTHFASLYQYNLNTKELKKVLEVDQNSAKAQGYAEDKKTWELTGMIDVSDIINHPNTFLLITQCHGWEPKDGSSFTDKQANPDMENRKEGSILYVIQGLER